MTIRRVGALRETPNGNRHLECETDLGIVAFWGDATNSKNISWVQALNPPVVVTAGTIASKWSKHAWWVPQSATISPVESGRSHGSQSGKSTSHADQEQSRSQHQHQAHQDQHREQAVDPYSVLGVRRGARPEEIRSAYLACIKQYHPDQVAHLGKELRELAHQKSQQINWAYQVLTGGHK